MSMIILVTVQQELIYSWGKEMITDFINLTVNLDGNNSMCRKNITVK